MFINQLIGAIFFRLFNFALLIFLGFYIFKKYALPLIYSMMSQKETEKEVLVNERALLEVQQEELDDTIKKDAALYESLKIKINTWQSAVKKDNDRAEKDYVFRKLVHEDKKRNKAHLQAYQKTQEVVACSVFSNVYSSLTAHFEKDEASKKYLDSMILMINERK